MRKILVLPIGTGDPELMNHRTIQALMKAETLFLRTDHHPIKDWLQKQHLSYVSFDRLYETADDFEALYLDMAETLWNHANSGPVVYAVPDPLTDRSVDYLYTAKPDPGDIVEIVPGVSQLNQFQALLREYQVSSGSRFISASSQLSSDYDPNTPLLIFELDSAMLAGEVRLFLNRYMEDEDRVVFLSSDQAAPVEIPLMELDRQPQYSHLSTVLIPGRPYSVRTKFSLFDLEIIMDILRDPQRGCPWDKKQTHESLKEYLIEEAWETVGAIQEDDAEKMSDELGDLLFQIVFHSSIGKSMGEFDIHDVLNQICRKMIRRHPHVFRNETWSGEEEQSLKWEAIKRMENGDSSVSDSLRNISSALPSLRYAQKVIRKSSPLIPNQPDASGILNRIWKLTDQLSGESALSDQKKVGELLLDCAAYCQLYHLDGETLLHQAADEYREQLTASSGAINRGEK